jgi:hypothetical protein
MKMVMVHFHYSEYSTAALLSSQNPFRILH